jgi:hypothetical protein
VTHLTLAGVLSRLDDTPQHPLHSVRHLFDGRIVERPGKHLGEIKLQWVRNAVVVGDVGVFLEDRHAE